MSNSGLVVYIPNFHQTIPGSVHTALTGSPPIVWWGSFLVNQFAGASQARSEKQAAITALVQTGEFPFV